MAKELRVHLDIYIEMKDKNTEESSEQKLRTILDNIPEISYQVFETEVQEY